MLEGLAGVGDQAVAGEQEVGAELANGGGIEGFDRPGDQVFGQADEAVEGLIEGVHSLQEALYPFLRAQDA